MEVGPPLKELETKVRHMGNHTLVIPLRLADFNIYHYNKP